MNAAESVNPEIMSLGIGEDSHFTPKGIEKLIDFLKDKTVAAVGPGIGTDDETAEFLNLLAEKTSIPLVLDADAINLLNDGILEKLKGRAAITPHIGEFARLISKTTEEVLENRVGLASEYAKKTGLVLVLKSADSIIALPDGSVYINTTGTPALAKGGSGDCLTGLIAGFASQGYALDEACMLGSFTLGRTAEIVEEQINAKSVLTTDIIENLWKTLDELEEDS
jgi:NAD(P)H-hydrate epimerase